VQAPEFFRGFFVCPKIRTTASFKMKLFIVIRELLVTQLLSNNRISCNNIRRVCLLLLSIISFSGIVTGQYQLRGTVLSGEKETPLSGASVFINGGSSGAVTDKDGNFNLLNIASDNFELVVSYVSFETVVVKITSENISKRFKILMAARENELPEVIVGAVEKDGWKKWGTFFIEKFIGTSDFAKKCIIKNPQDLRFRFNKQTRKLTVSAVDQLVIENNALGYTLNYQLEQFLFDGGNDLVTYLGYSYFKPRHAGRRKMSNWMENRREAYKGSITHFMRSLHAGNVAKEGFNMTSIIRYSSRDSSTKSMYDKITSGNLEGADTANYFIQVMKPEGTSLAPPIVYLIGKRPLKIEDIRTTDTAGNVLIFFRNCLQLVYKNELEKSEYVLQTSSTTRKRMSQSSIIYLINDRPIIVDQTGLFFEPLDVITEGYLGWEKLAESLPSDY
jgi:hypothetical protein